MSVRWTSLAGGMLRLVISTAVAIATVAAVAAHAAPAPDRVVPHGSQVDAAVSPQADTRPVTGKVALFIDESFATWVRGIGGCSALADVLTRATDRGIDKSLGATRSGPCLVQHGRSRSVFESYLTEQLGGQGTRHDLTLVAFSGQDNRPVAAVRLRSALLSDFATPKLQAGHDGLLLFESTFTASSVRPIPTTGYVLPTAVLPKPLLVGTFKVRLDGATVRPATVGPLSLSRDAAGETPGPWLVQDVALTTNRQFGSPFQKWYLQSVVDGRPSEYPLTIDLYEANQTTLAATISLNGVGIFAADAGMADIRSFELYAERAAVTFVR